MKASAVFNISLKFINFTYRLIGYGMVLCAALCSLLNVYTISLNPAVGDWLATDRQRVNFWKSITKLHRDHLAFSNEQFAVRRVGLCCAWDNSVKNGPTDLDSWLFHICYFLCLPYFIKSMMNDQPAAPTFVFFTEFACPWRLSKSIRNRCRKKSSTFHNYC